MSKGIGGIKLNVDEKDADKALVILKEIQQNSTLDGEGKSITCPKCNSIELYFNYKSMKGTKGILSMLIMFLFTAFPFYYKTVYKCKTCDAEFK
jgi:DNA-directed RNA polymerase subunit RPC12/RpoP